MEESQCRICLKYLLCTLSLKDEVRQTSIWEALNEIAKVFVSVGDSLPQSICWTCFENLEQAFQFKEQVEQSDNFLHSKDFERIKIEDDQIEDRSSSKNQSEITIKQEIGHEMNEMKPKSKKRKISKRKPKVEETEDQGYKELDQKFEPMIEMVVTENSFKISSKKKKVHKEKIMEHCCICRDAYKTESDLLNHVQLLHLKQIEVNQSIKYTSLHILECKYCKLRFRLRKSLKQHLEDPFFVEPFRKPSSKKRYKVPVVCTICGKILQGKHELKRHEFRLHATEFPFSCPHPGCERRFAAQSMLKIHLPSHGPKTHVCDVCGKSFLTERAVNTHSYLHKDIKIFQCDICSRTFTKKNMLQLHLENHFSLKIFRCDQCEKTYKWDSDLKKHVRGAHLGDLPFKCKFCSKGYFCSSSRKYHQDRCEVGK